MVSTGDRGSDLIIAVEQKMDKVRTRSLDVSFNELMDMYRDEELVIDPEYQRLFRWSEEKQSRFIESLILELPIPPIFVMEISDGIYELIDGLQRISSYFHFRGQHPDRLNDDGTFQSLILTHCDIVPELDGTTYNHLPKALEIRLKRNFVRVEVLRRESDPKIRYYMFKRLNTGGESLSTQEIRNCTIRLLNDTFVKFIIRLSDDENFKTCISNISPEQQDRKFDQELVLRFFAFKNDRGNYVHDVGDFMTDYMEAVSDPDRPDKLFDYSAEERVFQKTFRILNNALAENAFSGTNAKGNLVSKFLSYHYEAFAIGIQCYLDRINPDDASHVDALQDAIMKVKMSNIFKEMTTGGGKNYAKPLKERIEFVENALDGVV